MKPRRHHPIELLSRDEFREAVFVRDGHRCVVCGAPAQDAHHIIERRLFKAAHEQGGYFLDNGASLCGPHHIEAEQTTLSCDAIRERCGIERIVLPEHLYPDFQYDKWGNIITEKGRVKGELFYDESVQKILRGDDFIKYFKYPRTYHLPWSAPSADDKVLEDESVFTGQEVVVTEKMDGENFTGYNDYCHARSVDSPNHPSRHKAKEIWFQRAYLLDDNMRVCGENLYAMHTIRYRDLKSYLLLFSIWIDDRCLCWDETLEYAELLELPTPEVIYRGPYQREAIEQAYADYRRQAARELEGFVLRRAGEFRFFDFSRSVAKFVEPQFRQQLNEAHGHWISGKVTENGVGE